MSNTERLYLKFRPKDLDEVVGQKHIVATLKKASINNKFVHSYLFSGNRGCGKTTCARIVANLMNCENPKNGKLCGECIACKTIPNKMSMDVIEPDGATNRGIESIRSLKDSANFFPSQLKYKVYIIDECHMLTTEAWNALLAIVEEPPPYLKFIFCTTEPRKVIETISSRCQRFNFVKIDNQSMVKRLRYIADEESINIEDDALFLISKISRGILRDAIVSLEQISTVADGKKITAKHIQMFFGAADRQGIFNIVKSVVDGNVALVMDQVNDLVVASADIKQIISEISGVFRDVMLLKIPNIKNSLVDLPDNEIEELKKIGESISMDKMYKIARLFSETENQMEYHINERLIMEATLIYCSNALINKK